MRLPWRLPWLWSEVKVISHLTSNLTNFYNQ